jgi:hypothetical protein
MKKYVFLTLLLAAEACAADLGIDIPLPSESCDPEGLEVLLEVFPSCDLGMCGDLPEHRTRGRCVDDNQLGADQLSLLSPCSNTETPQHCVPVKLLITDGLTQPTVCESLNGAEGRCMSLCVPQIQEKRDQLPRTICDEDELCAPCYDPFTGESTGACDASVCDAPVDPPMTFGACCEDLGGGHCVPRTAVPDDREGSLDDEDCNALTTYDDVCVPIGFDAPDYTPGTCDRPNGDPGICMTKCVPLINTLDFLYNPVDCPEAHQLCVPCSRGAISADVDEFCALAYPE